MTEKVVAKKINLIKIAEPKFLTLTESPANQVAFRIVRADKEPDMPTENTPTIKRRVRAVRADSPLLAISFAEGISQEDAEALVEEYGLTDFTLSTINGVIVAMRADATALPEGAITVNLQNGTKAYIQKRSDAADGDTPNIAVVALRFSKEAFPDTLDVQGWLQKQDVDFLEEGTQNLSTETVVTRTEVVQDADTRSVVIETGVTAVVTRAAVQDVPVNMIEVVSEMAYGHWGWGQLDFNAALADIEFSEVSREALNMLDTVLRDIMFYSALPTSVKKDLVSRATGQFATYIGTLLDALPTQVVLATRSGIQSKEKDMAAGKVASTAKTEEATRSDADVAADALATKAAAEAAAPGEKSGTVTRSEVQEMITAAVSAAVIAVRSEPATVINTVVGEVDADSVQPVVRSDAPAESEVMAFMRSSFEKLDEGLKGISERVEKVESTTVVRSDNGDGKQGAASDPFKGMFGSAASK